MTVVIILNICCEVGGKLIAVFSYTEPNSALLAYTVFPRIEAGLKYKPGLEYRPGI